MTHLSRWFFVPLLAWTGLWAAHAEAEPPVSGIEMSVGDHVLGTGPFLNVGAHYCAPGVTYRLRTASYNVPNGINSLELWASDDSSTNCARASNRSQTPTGVSPCWLVDSVSWVSTRATLEVDALQVFRRGADDESNRCPLVEGFGVTLFLVPLDVPSSSNPSNPPEPILGVPVHKLQLMLDTVVPSVPTGLEGHSTSDLLQVSWESEDAEPGSWFFAYWDTSVGDDGDCAHSVLQAGDPAPMPDNAFLYATETQGTKASLFHLLERGVDYGEHVAVAVVQRDKAGNVSPFSEVLCLQTAPMDDAPAPTTPACVGKSGACSVHAPAARGTARISLPLLALVMLSLVARRRGSRAPSN